MIEAHNLSKKYGTKTIVKSFNYCFGKGIYLIKGQSGKGKTTLLNILALEDKDYEGIVNVKGRIFYLKDRNNLVNNLTVKEHFRLFEKIKDKKIKHYFDFKEIFNKKIKKLSLGERQLVQMNLVLNCDESILILDEAMSALSCENTRRVIELIENLKDEKTIILTSFNDFMFNVAVPVFIKKYGKDKVMLESEKVERKNLKRNYLNMYFRKTILQKIFFIFSLVISIFSYFFVGDYLNRNFDIYNEYFKEKEGVMINKKNKIFNLNENLFYEIIKALSPYTVDYNINYYNSKLYQYDLEVDDYYIDNAFVLSSVNYVEENLEDNSVVLGINYYDFCTNNLIANCSKDYVDTLLVNKKIDGFPYFVDGIIEMEDTAIFSNKRFFKVYEDNDYEEYYFDIKKENNNLMFKKINSSDFLNCFEFILIGENEKFLRYRVDIKKYKYFGNIEYEKYLVCIDKGYDCDNYLNHFNSLIRIDSFIDVSLLDLEVYSNDLKENQIVISSKLSDKLNKSIGEHISFLFKYNDETKEIKLEVSDVVNSNDYIIYQNSDWSFKFFKDIVGLNENDLRIKEILIYEDIKDGDYKGNNVYNDLVKEFKILFTRMKKSIQYVSLVLTASSVAILIILEVIQTKFKQEYFNYLYLLNVQIKKEP